MGCQSVGVISGQAPATDRRQRVLDAARDVFMHYGFRRATLEDIAQAAGLSRTGVYHHFASKEDLFREVTTQTHRAALADAEVAAARPNPVDVALVDVLDAVLGAFVEVIRTARHGRELVDETNRLCAELIATTNAAHHSLVAGVLERAVDAGDIDLRAAGLDVPATARYLIATAGSVSGMVTGERPRSEFRKHLARVVRIWIRGLSPAGR